MRLPILFLACAGLGGLLSGCATFGTNVEGDFSCRAPKGDCAPTRIIDAAATGTDISGRSRDTARVRVGVASDDTSRTQERKLRIIFPAHVDESGTLHDEAVAWAIVENPRWAAEMRRKPGSEAAPSLMRELKRQLSAAQRNAGDNADNRIADTVAQDLDTEAEESSPFSLFPNRPSSNASPLVLPSTAREAVAGAKAPAVEGFDMSLPLHDRTPRPHGETRPLTYPSAAAIEAAKSAPASQTADRPSPKEQK
jgi:conjugal transfer pilus assembly protein TraV